VKPEEAYDPEKYLANADTMVGKKNYDEARKVLLEVKNRDSQKKYGALAQLKIADTYIKEGDPDLAITEYRKFIEIIRTTSMRPMPSTRLQWLIIPRSSPRTAVQVRQRVH